MTHPSNASPYGRRLAALVIGAGLLLVPIAADAAKPPKQPKPPKPLLFVLRNFPGFRKLPARMIAFGPLPEHAPQFARRKPDA